MPVVPGFTGPDLTDAALLRAAEQLGPPLLVKAAGGGGGRGMRAVDALADLPGALESARAEAAAAFGDDRVFLERRLVGVRHVEVQVLLDAHGAGVHLGRARLLAPAPAPEDRGGGARTGRGGPPACDPRRGGPRDRARGRVSGGRHGGVPPRCRRGVVLPRDERAAPGGTPRHRSRDRDRPRAGAATGGRWRAPLDHPGRRSPLGPCDRGTRLRGGPGGRVPAGDRTRRPVVAPPLARRTDRHRAPRGRRRRAGLRPLAREGDRLRGRSGCLHRPAPRGAR